MATTPLSSLCEKLAALRGSAVLAIVLPSEPLVPKHVLQIQKLVGGKKCTKLDVVLHSIGGDINATYKTVELLRKHCGGMTTIVPIYAKSAAALFILGSDRIIMGELAELGPLDPQIGEREKGALRYASALNPFKTLEELQRFSLETLDVTVKLVLSRAELSIDEAIKHGMDFASKIAAPLLCQLNSEKVGEYSRALEVGKQYGERLLRRYMKWPERKREAVLDRLVQGYPSHDYIIDRNELEEIGFDAQDPSEDEKPVIDKMVDHLTQPSGSEVVFIGERERQGRAKRAKAGVKEGKHG